MLQLIYIRENKEEVIARLAVKNFNARELIDTILYLDIDRKKLQVELEKMNADSNILSKQIGTVFRAGDKSFADDIRQKSLKNCSRGQNNP